jgi:signal transduction histidine kinase
VLASGIGVHRARVHRVLDTARMRDRISKDLHDDIGANLTRIALLSEVAKSPSQSSEQRDGHLTTIANTARESVGALSDIVWAVNPGQDGVDDLVRRMRAYAEDLLAARDIVLTMDVPLASSEARLSMSARRDIYLVFKEAIANAARHSSCSRVTVTMRRDQSGMLLEVTDDGHGFDPAAVAGGNGLPSLRARAARLGATLRLNARPGGGTSIQLVIPERT